MYSLININLSFFHSIVLLYHNFLRGKPRGIKPDNEQSHWTIHCKIKVVSFDIGGTLLEDSNDNSNNYNLKELTKLVNMPYENVRDVYKNVFQKSNGTLDELIEKFCNNLGISNTENLNNFFVDKFSNNNVDNAISNDKITLIKDLKENGYKVILFSNSCCLLNNDAIKEIYDLVDGVFYSFDMGYTKDDKESYQYIT